MSVRPVLFNVDGSIEVLHDELGHGGAIPAAEIVWAQGIDGTPNHNFLVLVCPFASCGSASTWPVGGGADAVMGQQMFVNKIQREGCVCGQIAVTDADTLGEAHVRLQVNRQDGPGRWQLT
jgi:hypothetical protein